MKRILIFHPALAPYRVDFFNELGKLVDLRVVFMTRNNENQAFNQKELLKDATYSVGYLDRHYKLLKRNINIGYGKEIDSFHPDIVICNEFGISTWSCYLHRFTTRKNYRIYTICDDSEDVFIRRAGLRKKLSYFFSRKLDGLICINPKVAECYRKIGARKVSLFPIIYKDSLFEYKISQALPITNRYIKDYGLEGAKCLLFVGRLTSVKNLRRLIEGFSIVSKKTRHSLKLILIGDGEQRSELMNYAQDLGVADNIIFAGRFEGEDLLAWYNLKGSCVLLSTHEPFGAVIAEALMAGMPVIVSDKVGAKCLVNNKNGLICDSEDIRDITEKMEKMLEQIQAVDSVNAIQKSLLPYTFNTLMSNLIKDFNEC